MRNASAYLAVAMLAGCCIFWGMSFPIMQIGCNEMESAVGRNLTIVQKLGVRGTFNGWRFALAAVAYGLLSARRQRAPRGADVTGGAVVGAFFGLAMFLQIVGLRYTLASVSGFLTALAVIFAPLAQAILFRRPVGWATWLAVGVAVGGILLLSQPNPGAQHGISIVAAAPLPHLGEILTILASVLFTGQILALDRYGQRTDAARLTLVFFATAALINALGGAAMAGRDIYRPQVFHALAANGRFWWTMGVLVLLSSVVSFHLMNHFQPRVSPATASVVYCLEPAFSTLFSVLFQTERLTRMTVIGGIAVLVAVGIVALRPSGRAAG